MILCNCASISRYWDTFMISTDFKDLRHTLQRPMLNLLLTIEIRLWEPAGNAVEKSLLRIGAIM